MGFTPVKTPLLLKKMFPDYVWDIPSKSKTLYLTFDDGPTPEITDWTLETLNKFNARATFFCIGNNINKHPDIFKNILAGGHRIGNHTHDHLKGWKTKTTRYLENIRLCESVLKTQLLHAHLPDKQNSLIQDHPIHLFRPPYGKMKPGQSKKILDMGYHIVMWDVLSFDWDKTLSEEHCLNNVINKASNGSIVVFHDSLKAAKNMQFTLPRALQYFSEKGFEFKAINSL